jgi:hypothetical protein
MARRTNQSSLPIALPSLLARSSSGWARFASNCAWTRILFNDPSKLARSRSQGAAWISPNVRVHSHPPTLAAEKRPFPQRAPPYDGPSKLARLSFPPSRIWSPSRMAETVSYLRLAAGSGTTPVDQMRPALGWQCRCSLFRSRKAKNGTSFGVEQMRDVVWSSRSSEQQDTVSDIQSPVVLIHHPYFFFSFSSGSRTVAPLKSLSCCQEIILTLIRRYGLAGSCGKTSTACSAWRSTTLFRFS